MDPVPVGRLAAPDAGKIEYKPVTGFPGYRVGSDGSVWTAWTRHVKPMVVVFIVDRWKRLKTRGDHHGKCRVGLYREGRSHSTFVHRLVLYEFVGECPIGMVACHNDGDGTNNAVSNLRWDTPAGNEADKVAHGTKTEGEKVGTSVLTEDNVRSMRRLRDEGESIRSLARKFGVHQKTAQSVIHNRTWKHLKG